MLTPHCCHVRKHIRHPYLVMKFFIWIKIQKACQNHEQTWDRMNCRSAVWARKPFLPRINRRKDTSIESSLFNARFCARLQHCKRRKWQRSGASCCSLSWHRLTTEHSLLEYVPDLIQDGLFLGQNLQWQSLLQVIFLLSLSTGRLCICPPQFVGGQIQSCT